MSHIYCKFTQKIDKLYNFLKMSLQTINYYVIIRVIDIQLKIEMHLTVSLIHNTKTQLKP